MVIRHILPYQLILMKNESQQKIPTPPVKTGLFLTTAFWAELLTILDKKVQNLSESAGYGHIGVSIYMQKGNITHIKFIDEVSGKRLKEMAQGAITLDKIDKV